MPLFGKSHKSAPDIVKNLRDSLLLIEKGDKKSDKAVEEVYRYLQTVKLIIYGGENHEPHTEQVRNQKFDCLNSFNLGRTIGTRNVQRQCAAIID